MITPQPRVRPYELLLRPQRAHVTEPDCEGWQFLTDKRVLWRVDTLDRIDHNYLRGPGTYRVRRSKPALKLADQAKQTKILLRAYDLWESQVTWGSEWWPELQTVSWSPLVYLGHRLGFVNGRPIAVDEGLYRAMGALDLAAVPSAAAPAEGRIASLMAVTVHREVDGAWRRSEVAGIVPLADPELVERASFYLRVPLTPRIPT